MWFAFILVSLNHWKQRICIHRRVRKVVICFHFSIFEPLETAYGDTFVCRTPLWFAFILVSLNHWKQLIHISETSAYGCDLLSFFYLWTIGNSLSLAQAFYQCVVICFHFSIFEPLETARIALIYLLNLLWFAFILVSLNHWKQQRIIKTIWYFCCDLLSF